MMGCPVARITKWWVVDVGIQNSLLVKVQSAEREQSMGHTMNSLPALSNQVSALEGKHGLTVSTADSNRAMIQAILAA